MNTEQLETFLALAETKNFSRCAQRLIISQSAVSKRIFELEKELGQTLFHRSGGVALTGEGRAFRPYAEQMLNLREQAAERLKRSSQYASHLLIGCTYAYYDMRLGAQIDGFAGKNPGCSVKVRLAHSGQLIGLLLPLPIRPSNIRSTPANLWARRRSSSLREAATPPIRMG